MLVAKTALQRLELDQLWWMVTPGNPLKDRKDLLPMDERIRLSAKLVEDPRIKITGFEQKIGSYKTISTIAYILTHHNDVHFVWVMGADSLKSFHQWHKWREIVEMIPIAVIDRPTALMSALSSPMAQTFGHYRINEYDIATLPFKKPPAWGYIHGKRSYASSTTLRQQSMKNVDSNEHLSME